MQIAVLSTTPLCRVHRVGQTRSVTTIRYLMRDSFEDVNPSESAQNPSCKILTTLKQNVNIQKKKKMLVQVTFAQGPLSEDGIGLGTLRVFFDIVCNSTLLTLW
jgi:SWI/SNF-related matrix-associated actin-dependent regulator of chromatin subfamily A3